MKQFEIFKDDFTIVSYGASVAEIALKEKMHLAFGDITTRPSGVAEVRGFAESGSVVDGLGEGATLPEAVFTDDSGKNIRGNITALFEAAVLPASGSNCYQILQNIHDFSFADGGKYPTARLAVEMSIIDSFLQSKATSVSQVIGTNSIEEVPYGKSIGGFTTSEILEQAHSALENNAKKIKLKITPQNFEEVDRAIRVLHAEDGGLDLMVDANGGFDVENSEHLNMLEKIDDQGLIMIEEPVSRIGNIRGIEAVQKLRDSSIRFVTPICLDDCLKDYDTCLMAVNEQLADIINIKPGRIGSFMSSLSLIDYCDEHERQVMVGGMLEATPGRTLTALVGAYCLQKGFNIPGDLSLAQERLDGDLVDQSSQLKIGPGGGIMLPQGTGWGYNG